jgi:hypothetical protein
MKTGLKLAFMNGVVLLGSLAIVVLQWPEAMKPRGYNGGYEQGQASAVFLAVLLTGIPAVLYAAFVHLALSHWLFRPDELKAYRARQLVESLGAGAAQATAKTGTPANGAASRRENIKHDD